MPCVVTDVLSETFLKANVNLGLFVLNSILNKSPTFLPVLLVALYRRNVCNIYHLSFVWQCYGNVKMQYLYFKLEKLQYL